MKMKTNALYSRLLLCTASAVIALSSCKSNTATQSEEDCLYGNVFV